MKKTIIAAVCVLLFASCQEKPDGNNGDVQGNVTVKPAVDRTSVLHNPLNGWVMYASGSGDPSYWDKEVYVSSEGMDVKVRDYASAGYIRINWSEMNPEEDVYTWRDPNHKFGKMVKAAEERGLPIAFRVVVSGIERENGRFVTPDWVYEAGAKCYENSSRQRTPLMIDPIFREKYEKLVKALAEDFNDPKKTAFMDGYGIGTWGEGHGVIYEEGGKVETENTARYKAETMEWITSLYAKYFTEVPLVINYHRQIGHPVSSGKDAQPDSETVLAIALKNGYCLRSDAFGMTNQDWGYNNWERGYVNSNLYKVPVIMEGGYIVSSHSYWNDPAGYREGHPEDVRLGEYNESKNAHVNMMDFRVGAETESWFMDSFNLVEKFVSEGGYRLYPDLLSLPESAASGATVTIQHRWRNLGWGYFPNNLRQWDYKYKVAFALLNAEGKAVKTFIDESCEPSEWRSGEPYSYEFQTVVDVPAGDYKWAVAIIDTKDDNKPGIQLALKETKTADGWAELCGITIR